MGQNSKTKIVTKLKYSSIDNTQNLKIWQNLKTKIMTKLKNSTFDNIENFWLWQNSKTHDRNYFKKAFGRISTTNVMYPVSHLQSCIFFLTKICGFRWFMKLTDWSDASISYMVRWLDQVDQAEQKEYWSIGGEIKYFNTVVYTVQWCTLQSTAVLAIGGLANLIGSFIPDENVGREVDEW